MTPKEKAIELVNKFFKLEDNSTFYYGVETSQVKSHSKKCALASVDEILNSVMIWWEIPIKDPYFITQKNYWLDVKLEIEKYG